MPLIGNDNMILWPNIQSKKSDDRLFWGSQFSLQSDCLNCAWVRKKKFKPIYRPTLFWLRSILNLKVKILSMIFVYQDFIKLSLSTILSNSKFNIISFYLGQIIITINEVLWYFVDINRKQELCKQPQNYRLLRVRSIIKLLFGIQFTQSTTYLSKYYDFYIRKLNSQNPTKIHSDNMQKCSFTKIKCGRTIQWYFCLLSQNRLHLSK